MEAVILAGGYGKRLRPLTDSIPKALIPLNDRPIIEWQIEWFMKYGVSEFIILAGHLKEKIVEHMDKKKKELGIDIRYSFENAPLGTGGALKNADDMITGKRFFVTNGDTITNIPLDGMRLKGSLVSMALVPLRSPFGVVRLDGELVKRFEEKPLLREYFINAGLYLMDRQALRYMPEKGDMERTAFVKLAEEKKLRGIKFIGKYFRAVDSMKDMEEGSAELSRGAIYRD